MFDEKNFIIGGEVIRPGETKDVNLFVSKLYDFTEIDMPVRVIRGKEDGPRLFICAAIHGDEVNGVEIIKRVLKHSALKNIKGTLIAVPVVNVIGFNNLTRYLPDRRDMNRCFPGSEDGPLASRLAYLFVKQILDNSTHGIDLHTASQHRTNLSQVRACLDDKENSRLAHEFDVPVILDADIIEGSLREAAQNRKIPLIVFEGGEVLRYNEVAIRTGVSGILSVMAGLGMINRVKTKAKSVKSFVAKGRHWVRAPHSGILIVKKSLGSVVKNDTLLGIISDPLGKDNIEVRSHKKGVVIGHTQLPLVNRGDALFHIATFEKTNPVGKSIEEFDDKFDYEER